MPEFPLVPLVALSALAASLYVFKRQRGSASGRNNDIASNGALISISSKTAEPVYVIPVPIRPDQATEYVSRVMSELSKI